jgi:ABC-type multidrug transport system ATPase subunit
VRESVEEAMGEVFAAKAKLEEVYAAYAEEDADFDALAAEQAKLEAIIATAGTDSEHQLEIAADALRLPPWDAKIGVLSGGEKRRVALCRLLLSKPDMLLLDEPTNHLDAESVDWLEQFLQRFPGTVVAITHDRYFLDNAAEWILELDRGHGIPYKGNYSTWLEQKQARLEQEQKGEEARAKALKKELEWSRQNPKARQAKSKARLARFEELSDYRIPEAQRNAGNLHSCGRAPGPPGDRVPQRHQVVWRPGADRQPELHRPGGRHRRHHRPQRRRQIDAVQADCRQGAARQRRSRHRLDREDGLCGPAPRRSVQRQDRLGRHLRRPGHPQRRQVPDGQPRLLRPLQLQRRRPAKEGGHAVGR